MGSVLKRVISIAASVTWGAAALFLSSSGADAAALAPEQASARATALVSQLTLDEKVGLVTGVFGISMSYKSAPPGARGGDGFVQGVPRLGIPSLQLIGAGLGVTDLGKRANGRSTALPATLALAASFDTTLAKDYGGVIGEETRREGFNVSLGGGTNLTRDPRGGRAFEYHGEDPVLTGKIVAATLRGTQEAGVVATIKHFAMNDIENGRFGANVRIGERAMRESELLAFEIAIRESGVGAVMCAYNKVNGNYACENSSLLTEILKKQWGFRGWVMSDWGATRSTDKAANAGLDQEFFLGQWFGPALKAAVSTGKVPGSRLDDMVRRILKPLIEVGALDRRDEVAPIDAAKGAALAQRTAEAGAVLLKNSGVLPLERSRMSRIAVIGFNADKGVIAGGGSSQVNPIGGNALPPDPKTANQLGLFEEVMWVPSSPLTAIEQKARNAAVTYDLGTEPAAAAASARGADIAIVFAGRRRTEGTDVPDLGLDNGQDAMIAAVAAANPHTVVVLETGGAVLMPWLDSVAAVIEAWYPGQRGGEAIADLLFGDANPSGKLPLTFPASEADLPRMALPGPPLTSNSGLKDLMNPVMSEIRYDEGALVGYKWFDARNLKPLFPFGYGLSYTQFGYSEVNAMLGKSIDVSFWLRNEGRRAGAEIAQIYVSVPAAGAPPRRLAGWAREQLDSGERRRVVVALEPKALAVWDVARRRWVIPAGDFAISVGASSRDLRLQTVVHVPAERIVRE